MADTDDGVAKQDGSFPCWGMTLRDYFAGQALLAIVPVADTGERRRGENGVQAKAMDYAQIAYLLADAMLEARKRT